MGENSQIEWTDHSWSPWWGCTKISAACAHCYAAAMALRWRGLVYAKGVPRQRCGTAHWREPLRWNAKAEKTGVRVKVFPSMMDWLDNEVPVEWLADFLALIHATPYLDWLLLTKRPENFAGRLELVIDQGVQSIAATDWTYRWLGQKRTEVLKGFPAEAPSNVWVGATVEYQPLADERIPSLLNIPARVRFLSCEPLLGPVDLSSMDFITAKARLQTYPFKLPKAERSSIFHGLHLVIAGGESGGGARPSHPDWFRSLRDQCAAAGVAFFFKQWGEWSPFVPKPATAGKTLKHTLHAFDGTTSVERVGKKAAGRMLDGREWNEFPQTQEVARG